MFKVLFFVFFSVSVGHQHVARGHTVEAEKACDFPGFANLSGLTLFRDACSHRGL